MKETPEFKIGQIVWYMDRTWAHVGKVTKKKVITYQDGEMIDYEINGNWISSCFIFATKQELRENLLHYIDNNSPQDL